MSSMKKVVIIFSCILFVSLIGIGATLAVYVGSGNDFKELGNIFGGERFTINESSDLDMSGVKALHIDCTSADIHIMESDEPGVKLDGLVISLWPQQQEYLSVEKRDDTLYIKVEQQTLSFSFVNDFNLTVYLPKDNMLNATVKCTSGNIDVSDMNFADLTISRTSGDIRIDNCTAQTFDSEAASGNTNVASSDFGSSSFVSMSGDTKISGTSGALKVRSTSGNVTITGADGAIDVGCTSGDVTLDMAIAEIPPITAGLTSGNIRIYMPLGAAFDLTANATSGDITSDLNIAVSGTLSKSFIGEEVKGTCNGGGALVSISVTSGDISIIGK